MEPYENHLHASYKIGVFTMVGIVSTAAESFQVKNLHEGEGNKLFMGKEKRNSENKL